MFEVIALRGQSIEQRLLVNLATVAILRIEDPAILTFAPLHSLRELAHGAAFLDVILGLDRLQGEKHATT